MREGISVILPIYNERENLVPIVNGVTSFLKNKFESYELIIVDDGSRDGSDEVMERLARANGFIRIVRHLKNLGYGRALRSGFERATSDLILSLDSDGQFFPLEILPLFSYLQKFDVVVGCRIKRRDDYHRRVFGRIWNLLLCLLFDLKFKDINCGVKLFRSSFIKKAHLYSNGALISAEILLQARELGAGIIEVPVEHHPRPAGRPKGSSPKTIAVALYELARLFVRSMRRFRR